MKKELKKLVLNKETIASLKKSEMSNIEGGTTYASACGPCGPDTILTRGDCDMPTIGHDDGPNCISKTDWGWCWCYGV